MATKTEKAQPAEQAKSFECRLREAYFQTVIPQMMKQFGYTNVNQVPRLEKVVINAGLGDVKDNSKSFQLAVEEIRNITGQKPLVTNSKISVANFKLRKGMAVGAKATLRGVRMYQFVEKLTCIALPRVRDFRGVGSNFDGRGNYTMGIKEQLIFPEIVYDQVEKTRGFDVTFVTTAKTDAEGKALLAALGLPFRA